MPVLSLGFVTSASFRDRSAVLRLVSTNCIKYLNEMETDSTKWGSGVHPLLRSVIGCDVEAVSEHLAQHPTDVNARFEDSHTPLMHAVIAGDEQMVDLLLQKGADACATTEDRMYGEGGGYKLCVVGGRTVLHLAHTNQRMELLPKLEALGVRNAPDFNGHLPSELSVHLLDNCNAVRERMLKHKHAVSSERDQQLAELLGTNCQQVFLQERDEWQCEKICDGVYMLKCFSEDICESLSRMIDGLPSNSGEAANSMSQNGRRLQNTAVDYIVSRNLDTINSMISHSFPESASSATMKDHYTFAIHYAVGGDESLGTHSDRSAYTLNVCIAASCEGSEVYFVNDNREVTEVQHKRGWGLLHLGGIRHGTRQLKSGTRKNLVVWLYG